MAKAGRAGFRKKRLKIMGLYFQDLYGKNLKYPTVSELAKKFNVSLATIYGDLDLLRASLGSQYIPVGLKRGGKRNASL